MQLKKVKLSEQTKYETTPFAADIKKGTKSVQASKIGEIYHTVTGEMIADKVSLVVSKSIDRSEFIKLFTSSIALFMSIEASEIKVFLYLLQGLEMNTGKSTFDINQCATETDYEKPTIYAALGGLCQKQFIARTNKSCFYWVNPDIAFNGARLSLVKT